MKVVALLTILAVAVYAQDRRRRPDRHDNHNNNHNNHNNRNNNRRIEGRGQVWCGDRPASGVMVQLWSENSQFGQFGRDTFLGTTRTNQAGNFNIRTNSRDPKFHQRRYIVIQHTCGSRQLQMARFPMFPDQMIRVQLRTESNPRPTTRPPFPVAAIASASNNGN